MMIGLIALSLSLFLGGVTTANVVGRPTIVLSAPAANDSYYGQFFKEITGFMLHYAKQIRDVGGDNVLILGDQTTLNAFRGDDGLGEEHLMEAYVDGAWMRDFSPVRMSKQIGYIYAPDYLSDSTASWIQNSLYNFLTQCETPPPPLTQSDLVIDGGNVVDNERDGAVLTSRLWDDNKEKSHEQILGQLKEEMGYENVCVIPQMKGDTTGHSDGMVSFTDVNNLAITALDEPDRSNVHNALKKTFGDSLTFYELKSFYKDEYWRGFSSACGLHVNLVATDENLYVPTFSKDPANNQGGRGQTPALDKLVLDQIRHSTKQVVPIDVPYQVCRMGGSVRCLSWQVKGPIADNLVRKAQQGGCYSNSYDD